MLISTVMERRKNISSEMHKKHNGGIRICQHICKSNEIASIKSRKTNKKNWAEYNIYFGQNTHVINSTNVSGKPKRHSKEVKTLLPKQMLDQIHNRHQHHTDDGGQAVGEELRI